ncbi:MAG: hypothetical protein ACRDPH_04235 [Marmoricola sp.]
MFGIVLLLVGISVFGWNLWQRRGATAAARGWTGDDPLGFTARSVLVVRPAAAAAAIFAGLALLVDALWPMRQGVFSALAALMVLSLFLVLVYLILPVPVPRFLMPSWSREILARRKDGERKARQQRRQQRKRRKAQK